MNIKRIVTLLVQTLSTCAFSYSALGQNGFDAPNVLVANHHLTGVFAQHRCH